MEKWTRCSGSGQREWAERRVGERTRTQRGMYGEARARTNTRGDSTQINKSTCICAVHRLPSPVSLYPCALCVTLLKCKSFLLELSPRETEHLERPEWAKLKRRVESRRLHPPPHVHRDYHTNYSTALLDTFCTPRTLACDALMTLISNGLVHAIGCWRGRMQIGLGRVSPLCQDLNFKQVTCNV
jgi:hypothetical protein